MNKKRKNKENLFLDNNKYMKTYSFSLNSKRKCDKIIKEKLQEDSKTLFKKYYKSKIITKMISEIKIHSMT